MSLVVSFTGYTPPARFDTVPWTEAQIQEGTTSAGSWLIIDTISLSPVDPNPAVPASRSFTTHNGSAPNLWYRVVFLDATGDYTEPTTPIQDITPTIGTWTYDPTQIATNEVYQVRNEIGDTDSEAWLLSNEEIAFNITQERNFWGACARSAEQIGRLFMRKVDIQVGRMMKLTYSTMAAQYLSMAKTLRAKSMGTVVPYAGGMNLSDKELILSNSDLIAPAFTRDMMTNPWVGGYDTDSSIPVTEGSNPPGSDI